MPCHFQQHLQSEQILCIREDLSQVSFQTFWDDVHQQSAVIIALPNDIWALWQNDSYEFLVLLFAGLVAGKQMLLAPNDVKDTVDTLAGQNIHFLYRQNMDRQEKRTTELNLDTHFLSQAQVYFYTSGSTGQPKKIPRTLQQLLNEVQGLNQSFDWPEDSIAIGTVSHQHIYGLLFKLLLPLATGRRFYLPQLPFPEHMVEVQKKLNPLNLRNYVISSPALLKRWSADVKLYDCFTIFSSGGKLDSGVRPFLNRPIIEVLGSSETGGIAHRQQDDALWTPFANVDVQVTEQEELAVKTNHAYTHDWILTGDRAQLIGLDQSLVVDQYKVQFQLLGRLDRIVKLEEKRLSLDAIEHQLLSLDEIESCHVLLLEHEHRQILACVVVLTEQAKQQLISTTKNVFVSTLKVLLKDKLEHIAIPRQWRFLSQLPHNSQSKLNKNALKALFQPMDLPVVIHQQTENLHAEWVLDFIPELNCFKGHFPNYPIYPGVGQIGFIQHFSRQIWSDLDWCSGYEQLKFQDLIRPYMQVILKLERKQHKVIFEMLGKDSSSDVNKTLASGRLLFALHADGQVSVDEVQVG